MKTTDTPLSGLLIIEPSVFSDQRGFFYEAFQATRYKDLGIPPFVQDNISRSAKNTLRGLHYQLPNPQGKLVFVTRGKVWDVAVDLRRCSPTFGKWYGIDLSDTNHRQMYIPAGFAHGFCVLSDEADFCYKCTAFYSRQTEQGIIWNDKNLQIDWPIKEPILSTKDKIYPQLSDLSNENLFS